MVRDRGIGQLAFLLLEKSQLEIITGFIGVQPNGFLECANGSLKSSSFMANSPAFAQDLLSRVSFSSAICRYMRALASLPAMAHAEESCS